jgi:hypothetical protein
MTAADPDPDPRLYYNPLAMVRALRLTLARMTDTPDAYVKVCDEINGCRGCLGGVIAALSLLAADEYSDHHDAAHIEALLTDMLDSIEPGDE